MNAMAKEVKEDLDGCPYCDAKTDLCKASVTSLTIGALVRSNGCSSKTY